MIEHELLSDEEWVVVLMDGGRTSYIELPGTSTAIVKNHDLLEKIKRHHFSLRLTGKTLNEFADKRSCAKLIPRE